MFADCLLGLCGMKRKELWGDKVEGKFHDRAAVRRVGAQGLPSQCTYCCFYAQSMLDGVDACEQNLPAQGYVVQLCI